jgi:phytoene/squalene synthetase
MGIYFLNSKLHNPIYAIYGFVRFADEIVDSFDGYNRRDLLDKFKAETYGAIENGISLNPILNSFQSVVHEYKISQDLIETFLKSMEMDLNKIEYSRDKYEQYILGSAEVVGLMCLHVFTENNLTLYNALKPYAMKLGAAFQKVNFLRDLKADYQNLGRSYFPGIDPVNFSKHDKTRVEEEIEADFKTALIGIRMLPSSSRGGVYLAYVYYYSLFKKIKSLPARRIMHERIRINNGQKIGLMVNSMLQHKMNLL